MFAAFELAANPPVVIGAEERRVVIPTVPFAVVRSLQSAERLRRAAHHFSDRSMRLRHGDVAGARIAVACGTKRPTRKVPHGARRQRV